MGRPYGGQNSLFPLTSAHCMNRAETKENRHGLQRRRRRCHG